MVKMSSTPQVALGTADAMTNDRLVKIFTKIRAARKELSAQFDEADGKLKRQLDQIEIEIKARCLATGLSGFKTEFGTVSIVETMKVSCADWTAFGTWLKDEDPLVYLESRVKSTAIKEYMEKHTGELPPGVTVFKETEARVRAPTKVKLDLDVPEEGAPIESLA
jgi:hypothetical protein